MGMPVLVIVGSSSPVQKVLPPLLGLEGVRLAGVFADPAADTAIARICDSNDVPFHDMASLRTGQGVETLRALRPDYIFNINSMILFRENILKIPRKGILNLHSGSLPRQAGKHAHQWAIRNGEHSFGVTLHWVEAGIDTGDIALKTEFPITEKDTGLSLFLRYANEGAKLVMEAAGLVAAGKPLPRQPQDLNQRTYRLDMEARNGDIDWSWSARRILDFLRAADYGPFQCPTYTPTAYYKGQKLTIQKARLLDLPSTEPGYIEESAGDEGFAVGTGTGRLLITKYKAEGEIEWLIGAKMDRGAADGSN